MAHTLFSAESIEHCFFAEKDCHFYLLWLEKAAGDWLCHIHAYRRADRRYRRGNSGHARCPGFARTENPQDRRLDSGRCASRIDGTITIAVGHEIALQARQNVMARHPVLYLTTHVDLAIAPAE
jgi:hypothetical protein